jgi:hypothetical protein
MMIKKAEMEYNRFEIKVIVREANEFKDAK